MRCAAAISLALASALAQAQGVVPPLADIEPHAPVVASTDSLIIAGQWDHLSAVRGGGGGSGDWIHAATDGTTLSAGIATFAIGSSRWTLVRAGASLRPFDRVIVAGQASFGSGRDDDKDFVYRMVNIGGSYRLTPTIYLKLEDQYVDIGATRGHLPKAGVSLVLSSSLLAGIDYARAAGANFDARIVSGRVDWQLRAVRLFGGFAHGRTAPGTVNAAIGTEPADKALREGFAGAAVPVARAEVTLSADWLKLDEVRRRTLMFSVRFPLAGS